MDLFKNLPKQENKEDDVEEDENYDPEADTTEWGNDKKLSLPEAPVLSGEENDDVISKFRTKIYRWAKNEWKERGAGDLKFLQNKSTKKIRILLRQDKTHKVVANFFIVGERLCQLSRMKTNDKTWIWTCFDCSDEAAKIEKLAGRFVSKEDFEKFQKDFEDAYASNTKLFAEKKEAQPEEKKEDENPQTVKTSETQKVEEAK